MQWPTWKELRTIGNSGAVRAAILVPVIGYLIILNSNIAYYLQLHGIEPAHGSMTWWDRLWSTKLYLIYFGLMCLGLGSACYQWKCPHFVKKYSDWTDYVAGTSPHMNDRQIKLLAKVVGADYARDKLENFDDDNLKRRYLWGYYSQMSSQAKPWRILTAIFFALGFALLIVPSVMTAIRVTIALVSNGLL